jgi:hypothetical protein
METNEEECEEGEECEKCETAELSQETDNAISLHERGKGFKYVSTEMLEAMLDLRFP